MARLNNKAAELMLEIGVHACTDITGFGFLGHTVQMAQNSRVGVQINIASVPLFPEASILAQRGFCPGGLHRNRDFYSACVEIANELPEHIQDILFDPQTSGGLLISLAPSKAARLLEKLHRAGIKDAAVIGEVVSQPKGKVIVK